MEKNQTLLPSDKQKHWKSKLRWLVQNPPLTILVFGALISFEAETITWVIIGGVCLFAGIIWGMVRNRRQSQETTEKIRFRIGGSVGYPPEGRQSLFVGLSLVFLLIGAWFLLGPMENKFLYERFLFGFSSLGLSLMALNGVFPRAGHVFFGLFAGSFFAAGVLGILGGLVLLESSAAPQVVKAIKIFTYSGLLLGAGIYIGVQLFRSSTPVSDNNLHTPWGAVPWSSLKDWRIEDQTGLTYFYVTLPNDFWMRMRVPSSDREAFRKFVSDRLGESSGSSRKI